jgi:hypothetical protein
MAFTYKMVQIPSRIQATGKDANNAAANYVETIVNQMAIDGWEFHRIDQIGVLENPGCGQAILRMITFGLFGATPVYINYSVISFRRQV